MNGKMQWYVFKDGFKICSHQISEYDLKRYVYRHGEVIESGEGSNKELAVRYFKALLGIVRESKANSVYISINGYHDPKQHIAEAIKALSGSPEYESDNQDETEPFSIDQLLEMDGCPIWTITLGVKYSGRYELCTAHTTCACPLHRVLRCVTADGEITEYELDTYGKTWLAYARAFVEIYTRQNTEGDAT